MEPELEVKKAKKVELKLKNKYFWLHNTMIFYSIVATSIFVIVAKQKLGFRAVHLHKLIQGYCLSGMNPRK